MAEEKVEAKEGDTTSSIKVFISGNSGNKEVSYEIHFLNLSH